MGDSENHDRMRDGIAALDFEGIKRRLQHRRLLESYLIDMVEEDYRRFLFLCGRYPDETIVPSEPVDEFWHAHILDTRRYESDTTAALGFFLHHFPYFGLRGDTDAQDRDDAYRLTYRLYEREFGAESARLSTFASWQGSVCDGGTKGSRTSQDYLKAGISKSAFSAFN